jgi:hypothetical protein
MTLLYDVDKQLLADLNSNCQAGFELTTLLVIGIDCIGSNKSNYHAPKVGSCELLFNKMNTNIYYI